MFTTLIVQPIFNLLVLIYALIPGHNFGFAIIIFTIVIRLLMWPLVKKQLRQAKAMRELAPEIKKIKAATKGDRQKESMLTMELYREREVNPFASLGVAIIQIPIILALYKCLQRIIADPHQIINFSYSFMHHLPWLQTLSQNIHRFDDSLFGVVNLTRTAIETSGIYWVAMIIVIASAISQYFQTKQLMPQSTDARSLRTILSEASSGKQADRDETMAATSRFTLFMGPAIVFLFSIRLAVALPLYWLVSSVTAVIQQSRVLKKDAEEADRSVDSANSSADRVKIESKTTSRKNKKSSSKRRTGKRRRK